MEEIQPYGQGLDQPLPVKQEAFQRAFQDVEEIVSYSVETDDVRYALEKGKELIIGAQIRGIALSRLLYELNKHWDQFGLSDTFEDIILENWGLSKNTIKKYIRIWRMVFANPDVPDDVKPGLYEKPINTLRRLVRPIREEQIEEDDWPRLIRAHDDAEFHSIIKDIAGTPNSGRPALVLTVNQYGEVRAYKNNKSRVVGVLKNSPHDLEDDLIYEAYDRITRGANIKEQ